MADVGRGAGHVEGGGRHGLFGADSVPAAAGAVELPDVPEWPEAERLAGEKEVMGFYVTGHPLEKYSAQLASMTRHDSSSLENIPHESPVTLAGILTGLRIRPSRKGDLWAAANLEDMRGTVELLVFPKALEELKGVLKPDAALLIKGRVRHEENARPKVVVNEARPLEAAVNGANGKPELCIRLDLAQSSETLAEEIERLFVAHPGENPVIFELTRAGDFAARLRPRRPRAVRADEELLARLRELCGEDAVSLGQRK